MQGDVIGEPAAGYAPDLPTTMQLLVTAAHAVSRVKRGIEYMQGEEDDEQLDALKAEMIRCYLAISKTHKALWHRYVKPDETN